LVLPICITNRVDFTTAMPVCKDNSGSIPHKFTCFLVEIFTALEQPLLRNTASFNDPGFRFQRTEWINPLILKASVTLSHSFTFLVLTFI